MRSPGSTLKPLIYGLALSEALTHPETLLNDRPASYAGYAPQNFDGAFRRPVSARQAPYASLNLPVVELTPAERPRRVAHAPAVEGGAPHRPGATRAGRYTPPCPPTTHRTGPAGRCRRPSSPPP